MKLPNILRRILSRRFDVDEDQNQNMKTLVGAYKEFGNTEAGQVVLNDLLAASGIGNDPYCEGDPHGTSRNAGMNRIGLRILSFIGTDINQFVVLEKEMRDEQTAHKKATAESTANLEEGSGDAADR